MATLTKDTIQALAVLRAVSEWQSGAYGPVRLHKTLFFADKANDPDRRLFTFKRWHLGQYSDEIAETLNRLQDAGRIKGVFDGPCERIVIKVSTPAKMRIRAFFAKYFSDWDGAFKTAFQKWAYLSNDDIIVKAHDDPTYTRSKHGDLIFEASVLDAFDFDGLSEEDAEILADLVNAKLARVLRGRMRDAVETPAREEDWRGIYFDDPD